MNDELKLGFHRLGKWFEDSVNLGVTLAFGWVIAVWLISIAAVISLSTALALVAAGIAAIVLLRGWVATLAHRWRRGRLQLERREGHPIA